MSGARSRVHLPAYLGVAASLRRAAVNWDAVFRHVRDGNPVIPEAEGHSAVAE